MLAGLNAGQVQLLHRDAQGKVTVTRNDVDIIGWSADEILRSFLEVSDPTDLNTIDHIGRLEELSLREELSAEERDELETLRRTVSQDLLGGSIASEVNRLASLLNQARSETVAQEKKPAVAKTRSTRRGKKAVPSTTSRKTTR